MVVEAAAEAGATLTNNTTNVNMIRSAKLLDVTAVVDLCDEFLREYVLHSELYTQHNQCMDNANNRVRLQRLALDWIKNHYVIIAYDGDNQPQGLIIAQRENNFWDPDIVVLREMVWYMRPGFRHHRLSVELFQHWQSDVDQLIKQNKIKLASVSLPHDLAKMNLERRGWRHVESHWIRG